MKIQIRWGHEVFKSHFKYSKEIQVFEILGHQNIHFSMRNSNFWSKLFIINFWSSQCLRLLRPCRDKRECWEFKHMCIKEYANIWLVKLALNLIIHKIYLIDKVFLKKVGFDNLAKVHFTLNSPTVRHDLIKFSFRYELFTKRYQRAVLKGTEFG